MGHEDPRPSETMASAVRNVHKVNGLVMHCCQLVD
jgi:hypothetical protein